MLALADSPCPACCLALLRLAVTAISLIDQMSAVNLFYFSNLSVIQVTAVIPCVFIPSAAS